MVQWVIGSFDFFEVLCEERERKNQNCIKSAESRTDGQKKVVEGYYLSSGSFHLDISCSGFGLIWLTSVRSVDKSLRLSSPTLVNEAGNLCV